jgi:dCTP deaminase
MGLKNDRWIEEQANKGMIVPCVHKQVKLAIKDLNAARTFANSVDVISYGISSYGYDMRVAGEFKVYTNLWPGILDPKSSQEQQFHEYNVDDFVIIPPNSFALARSVEYFKIPRNVMTVCIGKSTYARIGLMVNVTAFEPEWEGNVTIELSNTTPLPVKIYAFEGIAQVLFFEADEECEISYKDKHGKYFGQTGITLPRV